MSDTLKNLGKAGLMFLNTASMINSFVNNGTSDIRYIGVPHK